MAVAHGNLLHSSSHEEPRLLTLDFDGTLALTSQKPPGGHDVNDAYGEAIGERLGAASQVAFMHRGHDHEMPAEILERFIDASSEEFKDTVEYVVRRKLEILTTQMGDPLPGGDGWPRPTDGFVAFWEDFNGVKAIRPNIGSAIISAGHTKFQQRAFDMWGLPYPDMFYTDDTLGQLALDLPLELQAKPASLMMELAKSSWAYALKHKGYDLASHIQTIENPSLIPALHVGDADKDRQLAEKSGADFVLIDELEQAASWQKVRTSRLLAPLMLSEVILDA